MIVLDSNAVCELLKQTGMPSFLVQLNLLLKEDFGRWSEFHKSSRHVVRLNQGVIELMPIADDQYYCFKYVNGHPHNSLQQKSTVIALGMLADSTTGYPLMLSSMTLLTALRTAAVSALASSFLAKKNSQSIAILGCGAQSEFQILAHSLSFNLKEVRYFDPKKPAMERFARHFSHADFKLKPASCILDAINGADIIISATSVAGKNILFTSSSLAPGQHISAIGGDTYGKTELDSKILTKSKVVVEYFPQTKYEGEIQNLGDAAEKNVYAELWELIGGFKPGRHNDSENTVFDSVGFALEDFSILRLCYMLAKKLNIGHELNMTDHEQNPVGGLYGLLS